MAHTRVDFDGTETVRAATDSTSWKPDGDLLQIGTVSLHWPKELTAKVYQTLGRHLAGQDPIPNGPDGGA